MMLLMCFTFVVVRFLDNGSSAVESNGSIIFTVIILVVSDNPFTVQVCTRENDPVSAEGLLLMYTHFFKKKIEYYVD